MWMLSRLASSAIRILNRRQARRIACLTLLSLIVAAASTWVSHGTPPVVQAALPAVPQDSRFGIAHVSYADGSTPGDLNTRYSQAAQAGARWNRWVIYWTNVETSPGIFDYSRVDVAVDHDRAWGFRSNAVLMGTPGAYATAGSPSVPPPRVEDKAAALAYAQALVRGLDVSASAASSPPANLYHPTFADGTDNWAEGKAINPNNYWARFVSTTVARYRGKVGLWEMWNEPDFSFFWSGSVADYVRLLKVGYLAAKAADPNARIGVGGMMYWQWTNSRGQSHAWLRAFLDELAKDSQRSANGYYFDVIPWHWYSRSSDVYWRTLEARSILAQRGISGKDMWVNESNAPACAEPPLWVSCSDPNYKGSATVEEQAAFVIQAAAYALAAQVGQFYIFQHYDDGVGEAFGLFRNDGSYRPSYVAYQVAARYLGGSVSASRSAVGDYEKVVVETLQSGARRWATVVWKRTPGDGVLTLPGSGTGTLVDQNGATQTISASGGSFVISLRGATNNRNFSDDPNDYIVGGPPRILVTDSAPAQATPVPPATSGGLLVNGSFESGGDCPVGPTGWACGGATRPLLSGVSYRGSRSVALGTGFTADPHVPGDPLGSNSTISQAVSLPAGGTPFLSFAYMLGTYEPRPANLADWTTWPDRFEVIVVDGANQAHYVLVDWAPTSWSARRIDLSPFRGQRVTIIFNLYQSSADRPTVVYVDEAGVWTALLHLPVINR